VTLVGECHCPREFSREYIDIQKAATEIGKLSVCAEEARQQLVLGYYVENIGALRSVAVQGLRTVLRRREIVTKCMPVEAIMLSLTSALVQLSREHMSPRLENLPTLFGRKKGGLTSTTFNDFAEFIGFHVPRLSA
jgi:hypothetical protein